MQPAAPSLGLTPLLRHRLEVTLPARDREAIIDALDDMLVTVCNAPFVAPPGRGRGAACGLMGTLYLAMQTPAAGAQAGPLSEQEVAALEITRFLHEIELSCRDALDVDLSQTPRHAQVLNEVRRELGSLPAQGCLPSLGRDCSINNLAGKLILAAAAAHQQITEVRVFDVRRVAPAAGRHDGGVALKAAAWHADAPPPRQAQPARSEGWDPNDPLDTGDAALDLSRAPVVLGWKCLRRL
ncbi:hypothetical protein [Stenotrophomonas sp. PD6]|uniref:hypothetical protein n=1 Tax=Stenotrophomonas sp. PD6 TaxID=3368612 RepID=UPI003BA2060C